MKKKLMIAVLAALAVAGCSGKPDMEKEAMDFLYDNMPAADKMDYGKDFFRENVRASLQAREEMPWGKTVPDDIFIHFVVPVRVNNEPLDTARLVFYREIAPRVKDLSAEDAILEVNHWCHEKVTYKPSDARTSSPLQTLRTSFGRCGEESTFLVAALRSVGIPARQVYTPRWAHTDDNHAWVEAWANGKWHFLGACEPEPKLDLGWFNAPASRGLLMHTRVFGSYDGPEEIVSRGPDHTEINLTQNYTKTAPVKVHVVDSHGNPVGSARVDFCIYNYAEFYPATSKYTSAEGDVSMSAGLGDMLVWASKDGLCGHAKASFGKDSLLQITIASLPVPYSEDIDIVPPPENAVIPDVTPEERALNDKRLAQEDSIRNAYMATFENDSTAAEFAARAGADASDTAAVRKLLTASCGNHETIKDFLRAHSCDSRSILLLESLSQKDLRDVTMDILEDSYNASGSVLCPRVENEYLSAYKGFFADVLSEEEVTKLSSPYNLISWVRENIEVDETPLAWDIPMSPMGVWNCRKASRRSRDIFFVSLARTLGIAARKDPVTGKIQYSSATSGDLGPEAGVKGWKPEVSEKKWIDVNFDGRAFEESRKGVLKLSYSPSAGVDEPRYYLNFTISKINGGRPSLLEFNEGEVDMGGGAGWQMFKEGIKLDVGDYELVSGARLGDGSVPACISFFRITADSTTNVELVLRDRPKERKILGKFSLEKSPEKASGIFTVGLLGNGGEPDNHALRDIAAASAGFESAGIPVILVCSTDERKADLEGKIAAGEYGKMPSTMKITTDEGGWASSQMSTLMGGKIKASDYPVFAVVNGGDVWFLSHGYTINLGATMLLECK